MGDHKKKYYNIITLAFTVLLISSNIAEAKICDFFGYAIGAGTIIFPLLYLLNDVLTEVYGFTASRKTIWIALCINCLFSIFIYGVILLPPSQHWQGQEAFEQTFSVSPRIVVGSVVSYFVGELLNAIIIALLKIKFRGKFFALRAIASTLVGSFVESFMFAYIAFFGRIPMKELIEMIMLLTLIKVAYEVCVMPITIRFVAFLKKAEGKDVFEKPSLLILTPKSSN